MHRSVWIICVLGMLALCLAACGEAPATMLPPSSAPSPVAAVRSPTSPPPASLPTAAPLWTPTPRPQPSPSAAQPARTTGAPAATEKLNAAVAAVVNGVSISRAEYDKQLAQAQVYFLKQPGLDLKSEAGKQALQRLQDQVLNWMIDQVLITQAAAAQGVAIPDSQVEAAIALMKGKEQAKFESWLASNGLTLDSLRQQVRMDLITAAMRDAVTAKLPRKLPQVHIRHILLSNEAEAQKALKQLRQGYNFISLANQISEDEATRHKGGDLGYLPKGVMPPTFEEVAFSLKPGTISDIVRSEFGLHIIQVVALDPARSVADDLWPMVQQRAFEDWLAEQRAKATIRTHLK